MQPEQKSHRTVREKCFFPSGVYDLESEANIKIFSIFQRKGKSKHERKDEKTEIRQIFQCGQSSSVLVDLMSFQLPLEAPPRGLSHCWRAFYVMSVSFLKLLHLIHSNKYIYIWCLLRARHCYKQWKCSDDIKQIYLPTFRLHSSGWRQINKINM